MANVNAKYVKFMRGTPAAYAALAQKDIDTLYFIAEPTAAEGCLYLGNKLIAGNGTPGMGGDLSELLSLNDLSDVIVNTLDLADASFLIYDQKKQAWVNCSKEALYFVGSSSLSDGKAGLVPAPMQGEEHKFLRADGTWAAIPANAVDAMVYQVTANEGEEKEAAIVRIVNGAELHNGDIAIVKVLVAENVYEHTAYIYNGANWSAMDGNYSAENVYFKSDFVFTENVGTVKVPETGNIEVAAAGLNVAEFFNKLFSEVKEPVITPVEFTASLKDTLTYYEVGTTISPKYSTTFTPGSYEFGPETGVTISAYSVVDTDGNKATAASGTMPTFTVADDTKYNIVVTATYGDGVKALNNLQKESDLYIEGNSISAATSFIRGYRSSFAGVDNGTGAIDSSVIRNLANAWNYNAGKILTIDAETIENPTRIIVAIPASSTRKGITEVIMPESMNFNCTADYVQQDNIMVDGAEGAAAAEYKVWVYAPSKMGADEVHKITMN